MQQHDSLHIQTSSLQEDTEEFRKSQILDTRYIFDRSQDALYQQLALLSTTSQEDLYGTYFYNLYLDMQEQYTTIPWYHRNLSTYRFISTYFLDPNAPALDI